jgi:hypothetical protein
MKPGVPQHRGPRGADGPDSLDDTLMPERRLASRSRARPPVHQVDLAV